MYYPNAYSCDDLVTFIIRRVYLLVLSRLKIRSVILSNKRSWWWSWNRTKHLA